MFKAVKDTLLRSTLKGETDSFLCNLSPQILIYMFTANPFLKAKSEAKVSTKMISKPVSELTKN